MNKRTITAGVLIVALALIASGCRLPASGNPPTVVATTAPAATATSGLQLRSTNTSSPPAPVVSTATLPPPTAVPPTAVPPTPVPPTQAPLPSASRIQFAAGGTSTVINGEVDAGQTTYYVLRASATQTLNVKVTSPNTDIYLGIFGEDRQELLDKDLQDTLWSGILPTSQDYYISLTSTGAKSTYSLTVDIPPLPGAPPPAAGPFDPVKEYGNPTFSDDMKGGNIDDWTNPSTGLLPDNSFIRITMDNQEFLVTGKQAAFSTWYFTWHELEDFYLQATFETGDCTGKDAYGLIVRGPEHLAGEAFGYVVAFSCDGYLWIYRLDSADPYTTTDLVSWTRSEHIVTGADKVNVMGIKAIGDKLTIYANGHQIAEVTDDNYGDGRYGIFVRPELTANYTYRVVEMSYWDLTD